MKDYINSKEREYTIAKEQITFSLRGKNKYYYAFQCALFEKNIIKYGYDSYATSTAVKKEGLFFNEFSITLGHYYGHDLKRFNSKQEMLGFVIGYNDSVNNFEYYNQIETA
jgi:hypothetical protein|tara:strand:- start:256 stop:588 length:333 start_codon:yes stop_codon:yes gene_type:complete